MEDVQQDGRNGEDAAPELIASGEIFCYICNISEIHLKEWS